MTETWQVSNLNRAGKLSAEMRITGGVVEFFELIAKLPKTLAAPFLYLIDEAWKKLEAGKNSKI